MSKPSVKAMRAVMKIWRDVQNGLPTMPKGFALLEQWGRWIDAEYSAKKGQRHA